MFADTKILRKSRLAGRFFRLQGKRLRADEKDLKRSFSSKDLASNQLRTIIIRKIIMSGNKFCTIFIPLILILSGCYPHIGPDGNANIPTPTTLKHQNHLAFNMGAYINQCYEKGFYDKETHDDMLNGYIQSFVKKTGKKPVITSFRQSVDYQGCEYFIMNFNNYRLTTKNREMLKKRAN